MGEKYRRSKVNFKRKRSRPNTKQSRLKTRKER